MGRYSEYCESGAGWLGELPSHWQLRRISALYDARNEKVSDQDYPPLSVTMQGIVPQLETAAKTQDGDNRKLVRTGDFVINSRSDRRGACGISAYDGSVTLISNVLAPKDRNAMSTRYYSYLFRSEGFADEFYRQGTGIVDDLWSTNWTRMKNILVARPPLAEQESIADYLDAKTAEIDALVADCEREVELLQEYRKAVISEAVTKGLDPNVKMKPSGIDWIGDIPEHWNTSSLKNSAKIILGKMLSNEPKNKFKYICAKDVHYGKIETTNLKEMNFSEEERKLYKVNKGDMLIVEGGAGAGGCAIMKEDKENIYIQNSIMIIRGADNLLNDYICFYMQSINEKGYIEYICNKATIPHFTKEKVGAVTIPLPPLKEQIEIVEYINIGVNPINMLIQNYLHQISLLQERKQIIINDVVTGKVKVV